MLTDLQKEKVKKMYDESLYTTSNQIAKLLGLTKSFVDAYLDTLQGKSK